MWHLSNTLRKFHDLSQEKHVSYLKWFTTILNANVVIPQQQFLLAKNLRRPFYHCLVHSLEQACDATQKADVAAVVMQEGLANLVLVTPAMTLLRAKVEVTIPRKRRGSCTQHEKVGQLSLNGR